MSFHSFASRLPLTPLYFELAVVLDLWLSLAFIRTAIAFAVIYFSVSNNIKSCCDDISMIVTRSNERIGRKAKISGELNEFIELHLHCYR